MKKRRGYVSLLIWLIVCMLFLIACNRTPAADKPVDKPVIRLAVNNWDSSKLNAAIAKILLEEQLGYPVEIVDIDEYEQWAKLATGDLHANLETWPSGHADDIQKYIVTEKTIENGGALGPVGKIGWYVPFYMWQQYPELSSWEAFQNPDIAAIFATEETGENGRFLAGDPTWVQYDQDIIDNLGLHLQVVVAGSETAVLDELEAAYTAKKPILLYFWTPHWIHAVYDLSPVALPKYADSCYEQANTGGVACDYPTDELFKIFWVDFKNYAPDAYTLLRKFSYTTEDQIGMLATVQLDKKSIDEAARQWIDEHEQVWQTWLPSQR